MQQARAEREIAGGSQPTDGRRPADNGSRPAGAGSVARPCRAAGRIGEGGWPVGHGHSAGWLRQLTGRPGAQCQGGDSNGIWTTSQIQKFQTNSICFKLWSIRKVLSVARKNWNKLWLERGWGKEQLFWYKSAQILNELSTKIQRSFYELNFHINSLENLGTLELDEIWLTRSLLHLIARKKINF
jgi:hypothetical protein